jgi:hypothetical protein
MTYQQVIQTSDQKPSPFSSGNGVVPLPATVGAGQPSPIQASFGGVADGYGFRVTVQTANQALIDPSKQYRVTIEEVQP